MLVILLKRYRRDYVQVKERDLAAKYLLQGKGSFQRSSRQTVVNNTGQPQTGQNVHAQTIHKFRLYVVWCIESCKKPRPII